ncbi:SRPBCC family protein [Chitinophaga barathri]|uniref:ATPase n=1 Tax=Chitinophaga barathri TaxID=1647451 RepID=A0A3N4M948_9BACT|nr:SRPBCC family protein [Chitinophaga barathri]RPD40021.1 ATPase [Chitinophaga barathri]
MKTTSGKRTDAGSRVIKASPQTIYQAFLDPEAIAAWRPPEGMSAEIYRFEPREGGIFRMSFRYNDKDGTTRGKTTEDADIFQGRFEELVPNKRIVEVVEFESDDPAFAGEMKVITSFTPVEGGTEVSIVCEDVPEGIKEEDHQQGIASSLKNLAAFMEEK